MVTPGASEVVPHSFVWYWLNNYSCGLSFHVLALFFLHLVRTVYLFSLASWKLTLFGIFSRWFTPGHFLRAGDIYSPLGLVTIMSPLASVLRCIYWSEAANYSLPRRLSLLVNLSFFSKSMRLMLLFCKEVYLYPCLDSAGSNIRYLSLSISRHLVWLALASSW